MKIELKPEYDLTDEACHAATGKTMEEWMALVESKPDWAGKRREATSGLLEPMGKNYWWPTTIWVESERRRGIVKKDGRPEGYGICSTKSIAAPIDQVMAQFQPDAQATWAATNFNQHEGDTYTDSDGNRVTVVRVRPGKDIRWTWQTAGCEPSEIEIMFADKGGKVGITLNHSRIQTRPEADGLRLAWGAVLSQLKQKLENS